jgi:phytoene dehydrogenase-like protein
VAKLDVAIVGAGHNGLVCATYLAKAGLKVAVFESRGVVGGPVVTEEVWPGYKVSVASFWMSLLQPKVMIDLDLIRHGIQVLPTPPGLQPFPDGRSLIFWHETARMVEEIRQFSPADAAAYPRFVAHMEALIPYLRRLLFEIPIDPGSRQLADINRMGLFAWRFRDLGRRFYDLWDLLTLSAHDFLRRWFESEAVLTAFGCYASGSGGNISPKTPGSAYVLARPLLRDGSTAAGPGGLVKGGMGSISSALLRAAQEAGVEVRVNCPVKEIESENARVRGVVLGNGEQIAAKTVVGNANAQTVFLRLVREQELPPEFVQAVKRIRTDSSCFKINVATDRLPVWTGWTSRAMEGYPGSVTVADSLDSLESAFEAARHGDIAPNPYLWILVPSAFDPSVAPPGKHVLSIFGGHVPYALNGGAWNDGAREQLFDVVAAKIDSYAPGFSQSILHKQVLAPPDLEAMFGLPGGHVHHGELSIDQIFFRRPVAGYGNYRSPIRGLYLCGASTHPGGGVTGVPGHNAAQVILKDVRR